MDLFRELVSDGRVYRFEPLYLAERQGAPGEALKKISDLDMQRDRSVILGIYEKTSPEILLGLAEFYDYKPSGLVISIGYRLRTPVWGRGIAKSTVSAMLTFLKRNTAVELVTAHVIPHNRASARVLLANGFEYLFTKEEDWGFGFLTTADVYTLDIIR